MISSLGKNTLFLTIASIGQKTIAFVYFLFLARVMQPEQTGTYFLVVSISMIFSVIADFGITSVVIREIAKRPEETQTLFRRAITLKIPFLFIGYLLAVSAAFFLGYETQIVRLVALAGIVLILDSIHLLFYGVLRGHHRLSTESIGMFSGQLITAVAGGIVLMIYPNLSLLIIALMTGSLFNVILSYSVLVKKFGIDFFAPSFDSAFAKFLMKTAFPFALAAIFVKVYSYVDTIFISKFLNETSVGLYGLAYKFTYAFQFLPLAFIAALYPNLSSLFQIDTSKLQQTFQRAMWYMLILATPIVFGIWLIAPQAVLLAGESYSESAPVLSILIFVLLPIFLDFPIGSLLNAANRQATKTAIMGATMILNIILNAIFIPAFGIIGAAFASLISFSFMFIAGLFFVRSIIKDFKFTVLIRNTIYIIGSGLVMAAVGRLAIPFVGWIAVIPVCAAVYIICLFLTREFTFDDLCKLRSIL